MEFLKTILKILGQPTNLADVVQDSLVEGHTTAEVIVTAVERGGIFRRWEEGYRLSVRFGSFGSKQFVVDNFIPEDYAPGYGGVKSDCVCTATTAVRNANIARDYLIRRGMLSPLIVVRG